MPKPEKTAVRSKETSWRWGIRGFYWSSIVGIIGFRLWVNSAPTWTFWAVGGVVALILLLLRDKMREFIWPMVLGMLATLVTAAVVVWSFHVLGL